MILNQPTQCPEIFEKTRLAKISNFCNFAKKKSKYAKQENFKQFLDETTADFSFEFIGELGNPLLLSLLEDSYQYFNKEAGASYSIKIDKITSLKKNPKISIFITGMDHPFIVRSIWEYLIEIGVKVNNFVHPIFKIEVNTKNGKSTIKTISKSKKIKQSNDINRSFLWGVFEYVSDEHFKSLQNDINHIIKSINAVFIDSDKINKGIEELVVSGEKKFNDLQDSEIKSFLDWMVGDNTVIMGMAKILLKSVSVAKDEKSKSFSTFLSWENFEETLGYFKMTRDDKDQNILDLIIKHLGQFLQESKNFNIIEIERVSPIYSRAKILLVFCRTLNKKGEKTIVILPLLFTRLSFRFRPNDIPIIRHKVEEVIKNNYVLHGSHVYRETLKFYSRFPRFELLRMSENEMNLFLPITKNQWQHRTLKIYFHTDSLRQYMKLVVMIPVNSMNSRNEGKMNRLISQKVANYDYSYSFNYSGFYHFHYVFLNVEKKMINKFSPNASSENSLTLKIESELVDLFSSWEDALEEDNFLPEVKKIQPPGGFYNAFSEYFKIRNTPQKALKDLEQLAKLIETAQVIVKVAMSENDQSEISIYSNQRLVFKDMINLFKITRLDIELYYEFFVDTVDGKKYIYRYQTFHKSIPTLEQPEFIYDVEQLLQSLIVGSLSEDILHGLVQSTGINLENINILLVYRNYFLQIIRTYRVNSLNEALLDHPEITYHLIRYFESKFNPNLKVVESKKQSEATLTKLTELISYIPSLSIDHMFRILVSLIDATVRTNYYQQDRDALAIKIDCSRSNYIPSPKPMFEIFVSSDLLQGVHLRGGKVARGGLRFSDRWDDFRTEVLGLMRTQMLKNSVIVPVGSKGGFIVKKRWKTKEEMFEDSKIHYRRYITALLSITDNIVNEKIVPPENVVRYDEDDPYLVVAADKGTATFSDIANAVSMEKNFWMNDGFASGGSDGYSHKDLGITAKGAWECVKHHFRDMGKDIKVETFSVVGIGDMFGDVFGNGMILSDKILLQGAFNHLHIFIDPRPNDLVSYKERVRMFNLPKSSWLDYNPKLISKGGGVFERNSKTIPLSPEMKKMFNTDQKSLSGVEIIKELLKLEVDLLWNGGIGTYIKSTEEGNHEVYDSQNDVVRVNANEVKAKIIGEGGNLGVTALGRIEYEKFGGRINADLIDNSAGVDLSDHEVNIKIFLKETTKSLPERNKVLKALTSETIEQCLTNNKRNALMLSLDQKRSESSFSYFILEIEHLERYKILTREDEKIPSDEQLLAISKRNQPFPRSVLSVLSGYLKNFIYDRVLMSDYLDDPKLESYYINYFPKSLKKYFVIEKVNHRLKKEIITAMIVNDFSYLNGISFVPMVANITSQKTDQIIRRFLILSRILNEKTTQMMLDKNLSEDYYDLYSRLLLLKGNFIRKELMWFLVNLPEDKLEKNLEEQLTKNLEALQARIYKSPQLFYLEEDIIERDKFHQELDNTILSKVEKDKLKKQMAIYFSGKPVLEMAHQQITCNLALNELVTAKNKINELFSFNELEERLLSYQTNSKWEHTQLGITFNKLNQIRKVVYQKLLNQATAEKIEKFKDNCQEEIRHYKEELVQFLGQESYVISGVETMLYRIEMFVLKSGKVF